MIKKSDFIRAMFLIAIVCASLTACETVENPAVKISNSNVTNGNMNESTAKNVEVKTDLAELEKQINLPVRPSEVKWTAEFFDNSKGAVPGPNDYRLTALLKYDATGAAELIKKLETAGEEKSLGSADVQNWFPEEIKRAAKSRDDRRYLEGAKYSPDSFFRAPYQNGSLIRVGDTNYFVLSLFSF